MRKVILLAGLHKTGTTSIQRTCYLNIDQLETAGYLYPMGLRKLNGENVPDPNQSALLGNMFRRERLQMFRHGTYAQTIEYFESRKKILRNSLRELLEARSENLLLVAEEASTFTAEELRDVKEWFQNFSAEVEVYCCLRKPLSWLNSMVAQEVIGWRSARYTIEKTLESFKSKGGFIVPRMRNILKAFPDTRFYSFDQAIAHERGPAGFFFEACGIRLNSDIENVEINRGKSDHAVRLNSMINQHLGGRFDAKDSDAFYSRLPLKYPKLYEIPGQKFVLRKQEMELWLPMLLNENDWLKRHMGEGFYDTEIHLDNQLPKLDVETRNFMKENFGAIEQPIRGIVQQYLEAHSW